MVVCRDCCTRTECDLSGLPGVSYADCLGPCRLPNVVVVRPAPAARRRGIRPLWLGLLAHPAAIAALTRWLEAGGPGAAAAPDVVLRHEIAPPAGTRSSPAANAAPPAGNPANAAPPAANAASPAGRREAATAGR